MTNDLVAELNKLPIEAKEDDTLYAQQTEYHNPVKAAKKVGERYHLHSDSITWVYRESKTEYSHRLYRIGEKTWVIAEDYEFLD